MRGTDFELLVSRIASLSQKQVAGRYLPNYVGCRWVLDAGRIVSPEAMLNAAVGVFRHLMRT